MFFCCSKKVNKQPIDNSLVNGMQVGDNNNVHMNTLNNAGNNDLEQGNENKDQEIHDPNALQVNQEEVNRGGRDDNIKLLGGDS